MPAVRTQPTLGPQQWNPRKINNSAMIRNRLSLPIGLVRLPDALLNGIHYLVRCDAVNAL